MELIPIVDFPIVIMARVIEVIITARVLTNITIDMGINKPISITSHKDTITSTGFTGPNPRLGIYSI